VPAQQSTVIPVSESRLSAGRVAAGQRLHMAVGQVIGLIRVNEGVTTMGAGGDDINRFCLTAILQRHQPWIAGLGPGAAHNSGGGDSYQWFTKVGVVPGEIVERAVRRHYVGNAAANRAGKGLVDLPPLARVVGRARVQVDRGAALAAVGDVIEAERRRSIITDVTVSRYRRFY